MTNDVTCQYGRCGGRGHREVKRKWLARTEVVFQGRTLRVCESCADLLKRTVPQANSGPREPQSVSDSVAKLMGAALSPSPDRGARQVADQISSHDGAARANFGRA
jgi:hypothetical protein